VPDVASSTYLQVVINTTDDVSPAQVNALRDLVKRHPHLFSDGMGCVREHIEDWMRLPVDREYELRLKCRGPYRLSKQAETAVDNNFDELRLYGGLENVTKATLWGLQVFVVFKGTKERPVVDMRTLNDGLAGDSFPLPRMESIIEPLKGMRWLGTVDITSAFYKRLLHPDDRHSAAVVPRRGVEQFATTVSDAHESSILAEVLGLASIFLPRTRLALLEPYSINSPSSATHFPLCHGFLRPSTPLASPREAAALPDDPRLASCSTRRLVCITVYSNGVQELRSTPTEADG
jgi:hypothetical protein